LRVQATKPRARFDVTRSGRRGGHVARRRWLSWSTARANRRAVVAGGRSQTSRHRHDAGAVLRDLAVMLAAGGECLSDLAVLRDQGELFGLVVSTAMA
jgi:hypothetical protein